MNVDSIQSFIFDLRKVEDEIEKKISCKEGLAISSEEVVLILTQDRDLKSRIDSLIGRIRQVGYIPLGGGVEGALFQAIGSDSIPNVRFSTRRDFLLKMKESKIVADYLSFFDPTKDSNTLFDHAISSNNTFLAEAILNKIPEDKRSELLFREAKNAQMVISLFEKLDEKNRLFAVQWFFTRDPSGQSPFGNAVSNAALDGNLCTAEWMLEALKRTMKVEDYPPAMELFTIREKDGKIPLATALAEENFNVADWILTQLAGKTDRDGHSLVVQQLMSSDKDGRTLFIQAATGAAASKRLEWLFKALEGKVDEKGHSLLIRQYTTCDNFGATPFSECLRMGLFSQAESLLKELEGKVDGEGRSLLVQQLITPDRNRVTPFNVCLRNRQGSQAEWILAQLEAHGGSESQPLLIQQLITADKNGKTPFSNCMETGLQTEAEWILKQLQEKGGSEGRSLAIQQITALDLEGKGIFGSALKHGQQDIVAWVFTKFDAELSRHSGLFTGRGDLQSIVDYPDLFPILSNHFYQKIWNELPTPLPAFAHLLKPGNSSPPSLFYCALALLEEPSERLKQRLPVWDALVEETLQIQNKELCRRATSALKAVMRDPTILTDELTKILNSNGAIAWRLTCLEIALHPEKRNSTPFFEVLKGKGELFDYDSVQRCRLVLSLFAAFSEAAREKKFYSPDRNIISNQTLDRVQLEKVLSFLFAQNKGSELFKELHAFRSSLMCLSEIRNRKEKLESFSQEIDQFQAMEEERLKKKELHGIRIRELEDKIEAERSNLFRKAGNPKDKKVRAELNREFSQRSDVVEMRNKITSEREEVRALLRQPSCREWFRTIIQENSGLEVADEVWEKAEKAFEQRHPDAFLIYLGTLFSAPWTSDELKRNCVHNFVSSLKMNFSPQSHWKERYSGKDNPHIREVEKISPGFYKLWQSLPADRNLEREFDRIQTHSVEVGSAGAGASPREILLRAVRDHHLGKEYRFLHRLESGEGEALLLSELEAELEKAGGNERDPLLAQKELILLTGTQWQSGAGAVHRLENVSNWLRLAPTDLFTSDIGLLKSLASPQKKENSESYKLRLRDDYESILLGGTEIQASCQHIGLPSQYSQGTVGYLLNGHMMLGHCDSKKHDKWVTRTLLRPVLLEAEGKQEVVLLLERIYPQNTGMRSDLLQAAEVIAKRLGIGLISLEEGQGDPVEGHAFLAGGRAAEYVDAAALPEHISNPMEITSLGHCHWLHRTSVN